jgi:translation machinery-associated protein 16
MLPAETTRVQHEELIDMVEQYLDRNTADLEAIQANRRPGRPKDKKQDVLEEVVRQEQQEYAHGLEVPDVTNAECVVLLRAWNGDINCISKIKTITVKRDQLNQ